MVHSSVLANCDIVIGVVLNTSAVFHGGLRDSSRYTIRVAIGFREDMDRKIVYRNKYRFGVPFFEQGYFYAGWVGKDNVTKKW